MSPRSGFLSVCNSPNDANASIKIMQFELDQYRCYKMKYDIFVQKYISFCVQYHMCSESTFQICK